jgi:alkylated DNA repair dioxygenase AlkB
VRSPGSADRPVAADRVGAPGNLLPCDGEVVLIEAALSTADADRLFAALRAGIDWRQEVATLMGRSVPLPRLTAWHGEAGYVYSGIRMTPAPWTPALLELKTLAEALAGRPFNSVLLNLYRDGRDSVSWHADNEPGLGRNPVIASFSLGAIRRFQMKHRRLGTRLALDLPHGSCLIMAGATQHHWLHQLPKTARPVRPRINLTFRSMLSPPTRKDAGDRRDQRQTAREANPDGLVDRSERH